MKNSNGIDIVVNDLYKVGELEIQVQSIKNLVGIFMAETSYGDFNIDLLSNHQAPCYACQSGCPVCNGFGWLPV